MFDPTSPAYLTQALRQSGVLTAGCVQTVKAGPEKPTIVSKITRLHLTYDTPSEGAPASLILKTRLGPSQHGGGEGEIAFYETIAPTLLRGIVPKAFAAEFDPATKDWHLLLEDLTDTHTIVTKWPLPPQRPQCQAILSALARHHAAWWDHPSLGVTVGAWSTLQAQQQRYETLAPDFIRFVDLLGEDLPADHRRLYEQLFAEIPRLLFARYDTHQNMTIAHGDAHVWNFFMPLDPSGDVLIFDWNGWRPNGATFDLGYMMAVHWYPDRRARMERAMLDHYHAELLVHGVTGYDRQALQDDYRRSVLWHIMTPLWMFAHDIPQWVWWNHLQRVFLAVDDLHCHDLL